MNLHFHMLFLDGVGIGKNDPAVNPFFAARLPGLRSLASGALPSLRRRCHAEGTSTLLALDATLGVEGLPQSGTGQTALFTGINAPRLIGRHFGPHPSSSLRPAIEEHNVFRRLHQRGRRCCFANAFPQRFFDYVQLHPTRLTVTTLSCISAGVPLLRAGDLAAGRGISADLTNAGWHGLGHPEMTVIDPAEAGRRLVRLTKHFDFVLFEYWKTDHAGHSLRMSEAIDVLEKFDVMLVAILEGIDRRETLLVVTNDHGNIEDMSVKTHTRNPVPAYLYGHRQEEFREQLLGRSRSDLCSVTPAILHMFTPV